MTAVHEKRVRLSAAQQEAVEIARENAGALSLYDGGYWRGRHMSLGDPYVNASTVRALVSKGVMRFTKHSAAGAPIRAELAE